MDNPEHLLAHTLPFWPELSPEEQATLKRSILPSTVPKGTVTHRADQECQGLLLLLSGQLRVYLLSEEGREVTLYRVRAGELCVMSSSCLMDAIVFDVLIEAMEDTQAITIPSAILSPILQNHPRAELFLYKTASERFSDIMWTMQQILFMGIDRRVAIFLWDEMLRNGPVIPLTHDEIARKHLVVLNDQGGSVMSVSGDGTIGTLRAETHAHEPIVTETIPLAIPLVNEKIGTLTACDLVKMPSNQSVANGLMFPELTVFENHRQDARYREMSEGKMPTLVAHMGTGGGNVPFVVEKNIRLFNMQPIESNMHNAGREIEKTPTLTATDPNPNKNQGGVCIVELEGKPYRLRVRKLLPIECERLMGMPDNWTLIPYKGKDVESCPDSPRYKACGNGWSVETITWIFNRLDRELHGEKQVEE